MQNFIHEIKKSSIYVGRITERIRNVYLFERLEIAAKVLFLYDDIIIGEQYENSDSSLISSHFRGQQTPHFRWMPRNLWIAEHEIWSRTLSIFLRNSKGFSFLFPPSLYLSLFFPSSSLFHLHCHDSSDFVTVDQWSIDRIDGSGKKTRDERWRKVQFVPSLIRVSVRYFLSRVLRYLDSCLSNKKRGLKRSLVETRDDFSIISVRPSSSLFQ